jgi:hypothetical protein
LRSVRSLFVVQAEFAGNGLGGGTLNCRELVNAGSFG